jgi:limonene-1,2-epoxide hydrolase
LAGMTELSNDSTSTLQSTTNARTVETFLFALGDEDFNTADSLMADRIAWQNVGFPTIRGRERVSKVFRGGQGRMRFEAIVHRIAAEGDTVLTERTDVLEFGPVRIQFWVCGVFEVNAGRITLWRDYFDKLGFLKATVRGLLAVPLPALRPTL